METKPIRVREDVAVILLSRPGSHMLLPQIPDRIQLEARLWCVLPSDMVHYFTWLSLCFLTCAKGTELKPATQCHQEEVQQA